MAAARVDHFDLVVSDLERSLAFYRGLLGPLGWTRTTSIAGERARTSTISAASRASGRSRSA